MLVFDKKSVFYKLYITNRYSLIALCICIFGLTIYLSRVVNELIDYSSQSINITRDIEKRIGNILLFDDVLTMSTRQFATSNDPQWIEKYNLYEKKLDEELNYVKTKYPQVISTKGADDTELANEILVNIEHQSFQLAKLKKNNEAIQLLDSLTYLDNKKIYTQGMIKFNDDLEKIINGKILYLEQQKKTLVLLLF